MRQTNFSAIRCKVTLPFVWLKHEFVAALFHLKRFSTSLRRDIASFHGIVVVSR